MTKQLGHIFAFEPLCAVPQSPGAPTASLATLGTPMAPARKTLGRGDFRLVFAR